MRRTKVILVGGGLANGLIAWRLAERRDVDLLVLERGATLGGEHTWSFHESDVGASMAWLLPLVSASWDGYEVRFPGYARSFTSRYATIRSQDFHARLTERLGARARCLVEGAAVAPQTVALADGTTLAADLVIDGRGGAPAEPCAFQTFYGQVFRTEAPHGIVRPVIMDATVPQRGGFRFVYTLPFSEREMLVEDTYYRERPELDEAGIAPELAAYARRLTGMDVTVVSEERGALPIPLLGAAAPVASRVATVGARAGLYQPTTGYSLAEAVRVADMVAEMRDLSGAAPVLAEHAAIRWKAQAFCRRLNNMLFAAARPDERRDVLAQFYRRSEGLIARFYAGRLTALDKLRIVSGKPPVPLAAGLKAFFGRTVAAR